MLNSKCDLMTVEKAVLKKYEGDELFEVIIMDKNGTILETINDKEKLKKWL